jgi:hypothetical protein
MQHMLCRLGYQWSIYEFFYSPIDRVLFTVRVVHLLLGAGHNDCAAAKRKECALASEGSECCTCRQELPTIFFPGGADARAEGQIHGACGCMLAMSDCAPSFSALLLHARAHSRDAVSRNGVACFWGAGTCNACKQRSRFQPQPSKMTQGQWRLVRRALSKPRRFSPAFVAERRRMLHMQKDKIRMLQQDKVRAGTPCPGSVWDSCAALLHSGCHLLELSSPSLCAYVCLALCF